MYVLMYYICYSLSEGEEDDFRSSRSKRFLSEEMMSEHMQNLHLATPPHCTLFPDHHNGVNEFDWLKGSYDSSCIPQEYLDDSIPKATPTDHKDLAPPINNSRNCENTVTMEENSEDSSDDDNDTRYAGTCLPLPALTCLILPLQYPHVDSSRNEEFIRQQ